MNFKSVLKSTSNLLFHLVLLIVKYVLALTSFDVSSILISLMIWYLLSQPSSLNICFMLKEPLLWAYFCIQLAFICHLFFFPRISSIFPSVIEGWVDVFINQLSPTSVHSVCAHVCACWEYMSWVCSELL